MLNQLKKLRIYSIDEGNARLYSYYNDMIRKHLLQIQLVLYNHNTNPNINFNTPHKMVGKLSG